MFLLLALPVFAPHPVYNQDKPFVFAVNPCSGSYDKYMKGWRMPFSRRDIREWGASRGLVPGDDRGPIVDDTAAYVGPFGSTIIINGLSREGRYRLWIDFVRFRSAKGYPDSILKVFASGPGLEPRQIDTLRLSDINESYFHADIPGVVSSTGSVELRFVEYSSVPGNWGIWDIIVAGAAELPGRSDIPGDENINLEINDWIVQ